MELQFHYLMLKQVTRIKYALRAALCSAGMYSGMMRGSINLPLPMISLFSEELPIRAQNKKTNLQDGREGARVLPRSPPELQRRPVWWGVMEKKVLHDPAQAQAVVVVAERWRIRQRGLAPSTCKNGAKVTED